MKWSVHSRRIDPIEPFGEAVLPRRAWRDGIFRDSHGPQSACNHGTEGLVPIADQVARNLIPGESFGDLACNPFRAWICGDVDPDKLSTRQLDDERT